MSFIYITSCYFLCCSLYKETFFDWEYNKAILLLRFRLECGIEPVDRTRIR